MSEGPVKRVIPSNLQTLWSEENRLIKWSEQKISGSEKLVDYVDFTELVLDTIIGIKNTVVDKGLSYEERHVALAGLCLRVFDSISDSLRLALSGKYSASIIHLRDVLETTFLLDLLLETPNGAVEWLKASEDVLRKSYSPVEVRKKLDARDRFTERKREKHYKLLSSLGPHPSLKAFETKRDGQRNINVGPFKNERLLEACVEEIARISYAASPQVLRYAINDFFDVEHLQPRLTLAQQKMREKHPIICSTGL